MTVAEGGLSAQIAALIRDIPDFPKPGVTFKDITPLLDDHTTFTTVVRALADAGRDAGGDVVVDKVVGMEARGFILAAPVALALGVGFVPVRKPGKLPWHTRAVSYKLEYGEETLSIAAEVSESSRPGERGSTGSRRSRAWIAVFSSTQNTAACSGGLRYRPMMSAALDSKSGSLDRM